MSVFISEWLPNPAGPDTEGEWIELGNNGSVPVSLTGWYIENITGKQFTFGREVIAPGEFLVLPRLRTKLPLRNTDTSLSLYNARGELMHESSFPGTVPEGKSFTYFGERFSFASPSPGAANPARPELAMIGGTYPSGALPGDTFGASDLVFIVVLVGGLMVLCTVFTTKRIHAIHNLFFTRD